MEYFKIAILIILGIILYFLLKPRYDKFRISAENEVCDIDFDLDLDTINSNIDNTILDDRIYASKMCDCIESDYYNNYRSIKSNNLQKFTSIYSRNCTGSYRLPIALTGTFLSLLAGAYGLGKCAAPPLYTQLPTESTQQLPRMFQHGSGNTQVITDTSHRPIPIHGSPYCTPGTDGCP